MTFLFFYHIIIFYSLYLNTPNIEDWPQVKNISIEGFANVDANSLFKEIIAGLHQLSLKNIEKFGFMFNKNCCGISVEITDTHMPSIIEIINFLTRNGVQKIELDLEETSITNSIKQMINNDVIEDAKCFIVLPKCLQIVIQKAEMEDPTTRDYYIMKLENEHIIEEKLSKNGDAILVDAHKYNEFLWDTYGNECCPQDSINPQDLDIGPKTLVDIKYDDITLIGTLYSYRDQDQIYSQESPDSW